LIADTHLGFDLPARPRVQRRRRGHDFFANYERALRPALQGKVDLVVHGGDLFFRSKVPPALVETAFRPLVSVAKRGVPVFIVPGNHERSRIPLHLWAAHPNIHIFDQPRTFVHRVGRATITLSGFPFARGVRDVFADLVRRTRYQETAADVRLLCVHQTVEGARVGPSNFVFRRGRDVIPGREIPGGFGAVLAGHIHRAQVLTHNLADARLPAPVIYPGSVERTSFAERYEEKGYALARLWLSGREKGQLAETSFVPLPARPMVDLALEPGGLSGRALREHVRERLSALDKDAIVRVRFDDPPSAEAVQQLSAAQLRAIAPPGMNVSLAWRS
jgi:DNA repair exonuclease SbcCD nuclease subunit